MLGGIKWQRMKIIKNVAPPKQRTQKKKKAYYKSYGVSFLDATVINFQFLFFLNFIY
jgi:hypothetical protein